jgi:hypothetical protein
MSTYSFKNVNATIAGPGLLVSLGYGAAVAKEGIEIAMAGDKNKMTIGADGKGMNTLIADKSGQITVRLLKTAPANAVLMAAYDAQSMSASLWAQNVITVSQATVGDIHTGRQCSFKKRPTIKYAEDGDMYEWVFDSVAIDGILGTY